MFDIGIYRMETKEDIFNDLDRHFACFIKRLSGSDSEELRLAALLISSRTSKGDICVSIPETSGKSFADVFGEVSPSLYFPAYKTWIEILKKSPVVGCPGDYRPLILDNSGRLYLYRYWEYEHTLAQNIIARVTQPPATVDLALLRNGIERLFPKGHLLPPDWQRVAACASAVRKLLVISGGPGTGKTTTVIKILALLLEQALARGQGQSIALAAPTGKAAARLKESIVQSLQSLTCSAEIKSQIPTETFTIHRLLGTREGSPYFRFNADNPLMHDIVVVDESSMADLPLMSKLFQAVPLSSHIILLGDRDQLASVEAGAVLGDICDTGNRHVHSQKFAAIVSESADEVIENTEQQSLMADSIVMLNRSYRFDSDSGIGAVSRAVRMGDAREALQILTAGSLQDIHFIPCADANHLSSALVDPVLTGYAPYLREDDQANAFRLFSSYTILCALRHGPWGVEALNSAVERILKDAGLINPINRWYCGRPVMITRNDYTMQLFNGDVGIVHPDRADSDNHRVYFPSADRSFRKILPLQLPEHETAYALTVHKGQGSEFDRVLLLLPDRENPVLSRELLYTAITRARKRVDIWGTEKILRFMINNPICRKSGLRDALWR